MPKLKFKDIKEDIEVNKLSTLRFYENKYFGLF